MPVPVGRALVVLFPAGYGAEEEVVEAVVPVPVGRLLVVLLPAGYGTDDVVEPVPEGGTLD